MCLSSIINWFPMNGATEYHNKKYALGKTAYATTDIRGCSDIVRF